MLKFSISGCLAAACSLIFASAVNAQAWADGDVQTANGDVFSSGRSPGAYPAPDAVTKGNLLFFGPSGDIFALGTDEYDLKPDQIYSICNNDPLDPFSHGIPSNGRIDRIESYDDPGLWRVVSDPKISGPILAMIDTPFLQGSTRGWIGPRWDNGIIMESGVYDPSFDRRKNRQGKKTLHSTAPIQRTVPGRIPQKMTTVWKNNPSQPRWEPYRLPLRVYISGTVEAARGGLVRETIKSALHQWAQASNGVLHYQITARYSEADVHFVEGLTDDHELAQACVDYHKGPIDHAKVIFLESSLKSLPESRFKGLCLHEIGHVFGILKHSNNSRDAMSEVATDDFHPVTILSEKDKQVMAALYERRAVPVARPIFEAGAISVQK